MNFETTQPEFLFKYFRLCLFYLFIYFFVDQTDQPVRRMRLQSMHSYSPPGTAMVDQQQPPPKINIIPAGQGLPRSKSSGGASRLPTNKHPPAAAKVEAEAEHLREIEGQDYQMMEGIIRRRLHRDSEDLDNSLEVKYYGIIKSFFDVNNLKFTCMFLFTSGLVQCADSAGRGPG